MSKKKTYVQLLKEAIAEFDTSDNVEVKGPMLDPILSWRGDGELPTNKDAAGILERYYFNEEEEKPLETAFENDKGDASGEAMDHAEGTGTEQAGTSDESSIKGALDDKEEIIAKEWIQSMTEQLDDDSGEEDENDIADSEAASKVEESHLFFLEQEDESKETEEEEKAESPAKEKKEKEEKVEESLFAEQDDAEEADEEADEEGEEVAENAIIEKLIGEMEEKDGVMTYTDDEPKVGWPDEKEAKGPMDHAEGSGTEQAGTGDAEGQIPDRKDLHDDMVEPKEYTDESFDIQAAVEQLQLNLLEADEEEAEPEDAEAPAAEDDTKKKLNVDKELKESSPSAVPGGPSPNRGEDEEEDESKYANEGFRIFKEEIEKELSEDIDDISSDNLRV